MQDMDEPYHLKAGLGGKTRYSSKSMAIVCFMLEANRKTYLKMVGYLHENKGAARKMIFKYKRN